MADKILSLESIKKCLEKIKELLSTKVSVVEQPKENNSVKLQLGDNGTELYFHGSTSPKIPVLKKKTVTGETSENGNLLLSPLTTANAIVLAVIDVNGIDTHALFCSPYTIITGAWIAHIVSDNSPWNAVIKRTVNCVVYYLEILSGYSIPEDTAPASSDEPEDDEGLSPQSYTAYEKPSETKQFHGESLYE